MIYKVHVDDVVIATTCVYIQEGVAKGIVDDTQWWKFGIKRKGVRSLT